MPILDDMFKPDPYFMHEVRQREQLGRQLAGERLKFLSDPKVVESIVSHWTHGSLPERDAAKIPMGATLDKLEKAIPDDDPRKRIGSSVVSEAPSAILANPNKHPVEVVADLYRNKLSNIVADESLYKYIYEGESSISGKKPASFPGYEQYKEARLAKHKEDTPFITNPVTNFLLGAGFQGAAELAGLAGWKGAANMAGSLLAKLPHPLARIAGVGLLAVPAMMASDVVTYPIRNSQWASANPIKSALIELGTGIGTTIGAERALGSIAKSIGTKVDDTIRDAFNVLKDDTSLSGLMGYSKIREEAVKGADDVIKAAAKPRQEFWSDKDIFDIDKMVQEGSSLEDATKAISEKVMGRQTLADSLYLKNKLAKESDIRADNFASRVKSLQTLFPDEDMQTILNRASESPGLVEEARRSLQIKGMFVEDINSMSNPILIRTAFDLGSTNRPLRSLVEAENKILAEKTAMELEKQTTENLWNQKNMVTKDFIESTPEQLSKLSKEELVMRKDTLEDLYRMGKIPDVEYRYGKFMYDIAGAPQTERELLSKTGIEVATPEWINSAAVSLKSAVDELNYNKWNGIVSHFINNIPGNVTKKSYKEFTNVLKQFENDPKLIKMHEDEGASITKEFSRILYGTPEKEMRNAIKTDIKNGVTGEELVKKWGNNFSKYLGVGAIAALGAATIGELIGPASAEAAGLNSTIKIIPRQLRSFAEQNGLKDMKDAMQKMVDLGYAYPEIAQDGLSVKRVQRAWGITPSIDDVAQKEKLSLLQRIMTPGGLAQVLFKDWASPQPQLAYITTMANNNSDVMLQVVRNVLKTVPEYGRSTKEIRAAMAPFAEKYAVPMSEANYLDKAIADIDSVFRGKYSGENVSLKSLSGKNRKGKLDENEIEQLNALKKTMDDYAVERAKYDDIIKNYEKEWEDTVRPLAEKYSSTRIALAVEDVGMTGENAWLAPLLSASEREAVSKIKDVNNLVKSMMIQAGEKPIVAQEFMSHVGHPDVSYKDMLKGVSKFTPDPMTGIDMSHFHHRSSWSKQMMPDVEYIMERYLPDANTRVGISEFWKTWEPFKRKMDHYGYRGISSYLENLQHGFRNVDEYGTLNQWAQRVQMFEMARLLAFSPSVALKHAFKVLSNVANYGFKNALENVPRDIDAWVRNTRMDLTGVPKDAYEAVMRGHINTQRVYTLANDFAMYGLPKNALDKYLEKFNDAGGMFLNATERFDRGTSFLNAMTMATKQGMTTEQASYLVMDAILKNNFLSGIHNPSWLRDPKVRLLFLFQGTPFKLAEQRLLTAIRGGGAIADAAKESYAQLKNLKNDIIEGSNTFKAHLIKDALMSKRDLAGNSYAAQLMRNLLIIGATIEGGKYFFDGDMWGMFHAPFFKKHESSIGLATNPFLTAATQTAVNRDEDAFWVSDFLKKWITTGGGDKMYFAPAAVTKAYRINKGDIPEIYKDSKFRYIFAIPTAKEEE